jgi:hypothetical protein
MTATHVVIGVLVVLNIIVISIYLSLGKDIQSDIDIEDPNARYYDENGNHIYYDRKLISHQKRNKEH